MPHPGITARTYPHKPAIIMAGSGEMVTYQQLDERSNQGAQLFRSLGLRAGDHIALQMENNRQFLEICWAAQRAGLIYTPVACHLKQEEMTYILDNCGARLFIGSHALEDEAKEMLQRARDVEHFLMVGGIVPGFESWEESVDGHPTTPIEDEKNGVPMLYSAGTTGRPKGVYLPPQDDDVNTPPLLVDSLGSAFGFSAETVYLSPSPLYHAAPLHWNLTNIYQGGTSVIMEKFDPERALALIEEHLVTHSQWVPIMFVRMLKLPEEVRGRYELGSHQVAVHAAAPCPIEVKEKMIDWWGPILVEYYSASEGVGVTIIDSDAWLTHKGSVGPAVSGVIHIVDDEGNELPAGEVGTVYFEGEQARFKYHQDEEQTSQAYNDRGWATTGDVGYVDDDGFLYLTDRKNFTIISGGVNIYPQEIENVLIGHEKIADVAVFGVPCQEYGEKVHAVVEPVNWADATDETAFEIMEWLRDRISHLKLPGAMEFQQKLPRMDNGKMYKRRLMEEFRGGARAEDSDPENKDERP